MTDNSLTWISGGAQSFFCQLGQFTGRQPYYSFLGPMKVNQYSSSSLRQWLTTLPLETAMEQNQSYKRSKSTHLLGIKRSVYNKKIMIWWFSHRTPHRPSTAISGRYGVRYENHHIIISMSLSDCTYSFFFIPTCCGIADTGFSPNLGSVLIIGGNW